METSSTILNNFKYGSEHYPRWGFKRVKLGQDVSPDLFEVRAGIRYLDLVARVRHCSPIIRDDGQCMMPNERAAMASYRISRVCVLLCRGVLLGVTKKGVLRHLKRDCFLRVRRVLS
jgi:hypothetical protein